jgi:hypothetical protein
MKKHLGLSFRVELTPGRKISKLERGLIIDGHATHHLGFQVPGSLTGEYLLYTPDKDIVDLISNTTLDNDLQALYQMAIIASESVFSKIEHKPPMQGMNLRVNCFAIPSNYSMVHQAFISQTASKGIVKKNIKVTSPRPSLPLQSLVLLNEFKYKDWKEPYEVLGATAKETYFVGNLKSPQSSNRRKVQLQLQFSNDVYTPQGDSIYSSGDEGMLPHFNFEIEEISMLDNKKLHDKHRLPTFAALLAAHEYTSDYLEIGNKGVLDSMTPNATNSARYRMKVTHRKKYEFEVSITMGDGINGKPFGKTKELLVNTEQRYIRTKL